MDQTTAPAMIDTPARARASAETPKPRPRKFFSNLPGKSTLSACGWVEL